MSVKISITGLKEIDAVIKGLPLQLQDRVLKTAHADAAKKTVLPTMQSLTPVKKGNLKQSEGIERVNIKKVDAVGVVRVGPRKGGGLKGFHGQLIEYGKTNRDGTKTQPKPFAKNAFEQSKTPLENQIKISLAAKLNAFMKRTIKKHG